MLKADRACSSAKVLLEIGDVDGAANRAYYAIFDAARAALMASDAPVGQDIARTHSGLISTFGKHLVKGGLVSKELGRILNRAHEIRQVADYQGDAIESIDATEIVCQAEAFIAAIRTHFLSD
ncbi:MAG: HEPN domain-containing protein [Chromatiales bacterium]|nr:HEPN domain-containing protein [Chromatiales bacterium]